MKSQHLLLAIFLFALGLLGIVSTDIPIPQETRDTLLKTLTPQQIEIITKVEPSVLLAIATAIGVLLHNKVNLHVPIIEGILKSTQRWSLTEILKYGVLGGLVTGGFSAAIGIVLHPHIANELTELGGNFKPSLASRFLYGGFTEEILFRFGFMTFIVWVASRLAKRESVTIYWTGILVTSTLFAIAHLPVVFQSVTDPSTAFITYYLSATFVGGTTFGWLYWKKGLESAFIAHIVSHVVIVLGERFAG